MGRKNTTGLIKYLKELGIDALRIPESSVSEKGYDYWPDPNSEGLRPVSSQGTLQVSPEMIERKEWPSKEVWENVQALWNGATYGELFDSKPAESVTEEAKAPVVTGTDSTSHLAALNETKPAVTKKAAK